MTENLFQAEYDVTKKSKLRKFYESKKILIYSSIFSIFLIFAFTSIYLEKKKKKIVLLSDNYLQAKVYLQNGNKIDAVKILKDTILLNELVQEIKGPKFDSLSQKDLRQLHLMHYLYLHH